MENHELNEAEARRREKARTLTLGLATLPAEDVIAKSVASLLETVSKVQPDPQQEEREKANRIAELRANWQAPKKHVQRTEFDPDAEEWGCVLAMLQDKLGTGFLFALIGGRGPGKTQIGVELMKATTQALKSALYCTAMDFFIDVRGSYRGDSKQSELRIINDYVIPRFLVIDEMSERGESGWEDRLLTHMINKRYNAQKDTLLISNQTLAEFRESIGKSIVSRLNETGGIIECNWKSFRA